MEQEPRGDKLVTTSKKKWTENQEVSEETIKQLTKKLNVSELFIKVCYQRGLTNVEDIQNFITINESWFHDRILSNELEKEIDRTAQALKNIKKKRVNGDYDADGRWEEQP